jgi:hypothetical protein
VLNVARWLLWIGFLCDIFLCYFDSPCLLCKNDTIARGMRDNVVCERPVQVTTGPTPQDCLEHPAGVHGYICAVAGGNEICYFTVLSSIIMVHFRIELTVRVENMLVLPRLGVVARMQNP